MPKLHDFSLIFKCYDFSMDGNFFSHFPGFPEPVGTLLIVCHAPSKIAVIILNYEQWFYHTELHPKDTDGMTTSEDPNQTVPSFRSI